MTSMLGLAASLIVAQQPLPLGPSTPLPPNHPPIDGAPAAPGPVGAAAGGSSGRPETVADLVRSLDASPELRTKDRPFELSMSIGGLYFVSGRFSDALFFFEQASAKAEPARKRWLQVRRGGSPHPLAEDVGCARGPSTTLDDLLAKSSAKGASLPVEYLCGRSAAEAGAEAECQVARTKVLLGDFEGAFAAFERALAVDAGHVEARYGRGALRFDRAPDDVAALALAKTDFEHVIDRGQGSPRVAQAKRLLERVTLALAAGGVGRLPLTQGPAPVYQATSGGSVRDGGPAGGVLAVAAEASAARDATQPGPVTGSPRPGGPPPTASPPPLSPEVMEAFSKQQASPEAQRQVEKLIDTGEEALARGEHEAALAAFKAGMPIAPTNGRLRAGLAWALDRLGKPTAERIWTVALEDPEAIARLSDTLATRGNAAGAEALRRKLVAALPGYAARYPTQKR